MYDFKDQAERLLQDVFLGECLCGVLFGPSLTVLVTDKIVKQKYRYKNSFIKLETTWAVFQSIPEHLLISTNEQDLPEASIDEQLKLLYSLYDKVISKIYLAIQQPHLIIEFEDGPSMFIHGYNNRYETWQTGAHEVEQDLAVLIVNVPGGELVIWG